MNCPRHQAELAPTTVDTHVLDRCPECAGLWIPGRTIDALLGSGERLKLRSLCSARNSDLSCPLDGKVLGVAVIAGVTLDLCPECNGLWLDWGELELLQQRVKVKPGAIVVGTRAPKLPSTPQNAWIAGEVVLQGLLGLINL